MVGSKPQRRRAARGECPGIWPSITPKQPVRVRPKQAVQASGANSALGRLDFSPGRLERPLFTQSRLPAAARVDSIRWQRRRSGRCRVSTFSGHRVSRAEVFRVVDRPPIATVLAAETEGPIGGLTLSTLSRSLPSAGRRSRRGWSPWLRDREHACRPNIWSS